MRASGNTLVHSPNGRFVVTISDPRSPLQITNDAYEKDDPAWCGNRVAFWSKKTGTQQIYTADATKAGGPHAAIARVAGAVARPGSHRTVRTLVVYGSSGRRVMTPAAGRFATSKSSP